MVFKAVLISIFSDVSKIQSLIPLLASLQFQKIMLLIPLAGLFSERRLLQHVKKSILTTPYGKTLIFYSIWMVFSIPLSVYPGSCVTFLTEHYWKLWVALCLIIAYGVSRESYDKMIWAVILAASVFSLAAFASKGSGRFQLTEAYDPNENALLFVLTFPLVFWKTITSRGWKKPAAGVLALLLVIGIMETGSRGGFLGLIAVICVSLVQCRREYRIGLGKLLIVPALLLLTLYSCGGSQYLDRVTSTFDTEQNYNYTADTGRLAIWRQGVDMMITNPVLGVGVYQFISAQGILYRSEGGKWQAAHNTFVQVGAELGFPGLIAFCFILYSTIKSLRTVSRGKGAGNNYASLMSHALIGSWTGFIVCASFLSVAYTNIYFLLFGFSVALLNIADTAGLNSEPGLGRR